MANLAERIPENITGHFFVDASCIDCDLCRCTAPASFRRQDEIGLSIVYRQPESAVEIALAEDALRGCPVGAIGREQNPADE